VLCKLLPSSFFLCIIRRCSLHAFILGGLSTGGLNLVGCPLNFLLGSVLVWCEQGLIALIFVLCACMLICSGPSTGITSQRATPHSASRNGCNATPCKQKGRLCQTLQGKRGGHATPCKQKDGAMPHLCMLESFFYFGLAFTHRSCYFVLSILLSPRCFSAP